MTLSPDRVTTLHLCRCIATTVSPKSNASKSTSGLNMHDADGIDTIVVGARVVAVHSFARKGVTGTAHRHGDVVAELDEALAMMRRILDL